VSRKLLKFTCFFCQELRGYKDCGEQEWFLLSFPQFKKLTFLHTRRQQTGQKQLIMMGAIEGFTDKHVHGDEGICSSHGYWWCLYNLGQCF
jgi:hypothetical protein